MRHLEKTIREIKKQLPVDKPQDTVSADDDPLSSGNDPSYEDSPAEDWPVLEDDTGPFQMDPEPRVVDSSYSTHPNFHVNPPLSSQPSPTLVDELKILSLEATADRHLGSTSGIPFAQLTSMVLRRLTPDKADFVFVNNSEVCNDPPLFDINSPSDVFNTSVFESLNQSISIQPVLFGDISLEGITEPNETLSGFDLPSDDPHINMLVEFYFAHSHTLYPILHKEEFLQSFKQAREDIQSHTSTSPVVLFRIWMVLAIGSTAWSSVSLTEESESMVYYNKALTYLEPALAFGEMVGSPVLTMVVYHTNYHIGCPRSYYATGILFLFQSTRTKYV